jgi:hypothetical protein
MTRQTICGVSVDAFANKPDPEELASIVSAMMPKQQAQFIISLGYHLRGCGEYRSTQYQQILSAICEAITVDEAANLHGFGSGLIHDLQTEMETTE